MMSEAWPDKERTHRRSPIAGTNFRIGIQCLRLPEQPNDIMIFMSTDVHFHNDDSVVASSHGYERLLFSYLDIL